MAQKEKVCLLVVDDEPLNRELLSRVLGREYEIIEAPDAREAEVLMEERADSIEIILCDQLMPGRSGTELAESVHKRWPGTYFMLLTGFDDDPVVAKAVSRGYVHEVLSKPWRGRKLKERIRERLDRAT